MYTYTGLPVPLRWKTMQTEDTCQATVCAHQLLVGRQQRSCATIPAHEIDVDDGRAIKKQQQGSFFFSPARRSPPPPPPYSAETNRAIDHRQPIVPPVETMPRLLGRALSMAFRVLIGMSNVSTPLPPTPHPPPSPPPTTVLSLGDVWVD